MMSDSVFVYLSHIIQLTQTEGPGNRFAIWTSKVQVPEPDRISRIYTHILDLEQLCSLVQDVSHTIEGITILGERPFDQSAFLAEFARVIKSIGLNLMTHSERTLQELKSLAVVDKGVRMLLNHTDILVAGRYITKQLDDSRPWVGSKNRQSYLLNTDHYTQDVLKTNQQSIELRLMNEGDSKVGYINGRPQHKSHSESFIFGRYLSLGLKHIMGKQWIDDLFHCEIPTIQYEGDWCRDEQYWLVVLAKCRHRCLKWMTQQSSDVLLPRRVGDGVRDVHLLDFELYSVPLVFGGVTEVIFRGPKVWGKAIKSWSERYRLSPNKIENDHYDLGDWILLASFFHKFTRPKMLRWICTEVLQKHSTDRDFFITWMINQSPLVGLLEPRLGIDVLLHLDAQIKTLSKVIDLISPKLPSYWLHSSLIVRVAESYLSGDSWRHLKSICKLNEWAVQHRFYSLGEACIKTISELFKDVDPEVYFKGTAPSVEALESLREERFEIINLAHAWSDLIVFARGCTYADESYQEAQLILRYAQRWKALIEPLNVHLVYSETLLRADSVEEL